MLQIIFTIYLKKKNTKTKSHSSLKEFDYFTYANMTYPRKCIKLKKILHFLVIAVPAITINIMVALNDFAKCIAKQAPLRQLTGRSITVACSVHSL